ncbi:glycosyltransferase family 2 protein [Riemerella anatipestifer]|uniref:Glycosyl transferase family 2 n=1 Tax=Riemerella anatipestifer TaxID=34085 RepID=A0AAP3EV39_RIEAN|nr:hypothetical protein [Riemerella anatipestifer]AZZ58436.1 hypothetical protein AWB57_04930 [Riemerella anatipestifer]MBT0552483.1 hypothetical protein [Riemerella anatipestifer]MBT0554783.1 hypothetical protein [Riemerella anatipestifer]MBT0572867.1 hypothetical protein [Riemerella anatipestifer]MCE3025364.1 hypothetical protein [Riemerella anatipestifer]
MTILIKSFYRPYLLERCLRSIYEKVSDVYQIDIVVLDDGTPEKYLNRIKEKYPKVSFKFSKYREEKITKIVKHLEGVENYYDIRIPTDLWYTAVSESSEILIMTEDDVWFIDDFDMHFYAQEMEKYGIHILKLGRILNKDTQYIENRTLTEKISFHKPRYIVRSAKFYKMLLKNSFKLKTFLEKLHLLPEGWRKQLWTMYDIPMGMYRKDYLKFLWKDQYKRVVEDLQLINAVDWDLNFSAQGEAGMHKYTLLNNRAMATSYRSSASFNSFNIEDYFDLVRFNYILNELWYEGKFDSYENFPEDFSVDYIYGILLENENKSFADKWKKWTESFIEMHKGS